MTFSAKQFAIQHPSDDHDHAHDGLNQDMEVLFRAMPDRRRLLRMLTLGAIAPASLMACNSGTTDETSTTTSTATTTTTSGSCSAIPSETAGPYPGDGTNGANALALSGIVRSNIKGSLTTSAVAAGVPLTITLKLVSQSCVNLAGYAVYLWHCDQDGNYSMYSSGVTNENYLRGVQVADNDGNVTFSTIFPGCYSGRYPHVHFEVFPSLAQATSGSNDVKTSQFTFSNSVFSAVYASSGYSASAGNLTGISLASDNVFSDGASLQVASTSGSESGGYTASLQVAV
ncbi:MAG: intradiol ring-cleavage dioxygenase [Burkholderiaceae bacterium]|nr:intradiol ring-cleavage dioxygenase [Burkholderiaceae bacterium]